MLTCPRWISVDERLLDTVLEDYLEVIEDNDGWSDSEREGIKELRKDLPELIKQYGQFHDTFEAMTKQIDEEQF